MDMGLQIWYTGYVGVQMGLLNNPKEKVQTLSEIGQGLLFHSSSRLWITFCSKRI